MSLVPKGCSLVLHLHCQLHRRHRIVRQIRNSQWRNTPVSIRSETKKVRHTQNGRLREGRREDGKDSKEALSAFEVD